MGVVVEDLSFGYRDSPFLRDLNLQAPRGKFSVILGRNGSGKSTLLRLIAGILRPQKGSVKIFGEKINDLSMAERAKLVGYLAQFHQPVFPFTVEEVVLTGRASYVFSIPRKGDREKAQEAIVKVGIEDLKDRPYSELSGGATVGHDCPGPGSRPQGYSSG